MASSATSCLATGDWLCLCPNGPGHVSQRPGLDRRTVSKGRVEYSLGHSCSGRSYLPLLSIRGSGCFAVFSWSGTTCHKIGRRCWHKVRGRDGVRFTSLTAYMSTDEWRLPARPSSRLSDPWTKSHAAMSAVQWRRRHVSTPTRPGSRAARRVRLASATETYVRAFAFILTPLI